jgi:hypothetical protein
MAKYRVVTEYADGSVRTLETADGTKAMHEASQSCHQQEQDKTVTLEKDGTVIWSEKVKKYKGEPVEAG